MKQYFWFWCAEKKHFEGSEPYCFFSMNPPNGTCFTLKPQGSDGWGMTISQEPRAWVWDPCPALQPRVSFAGEACLPLAHPSGRLGGGWSGLRAAKKEWNWEFPKSGKRISFASWHLPEGSWLLGIWSNCWRFRSFSICSLFLSNPSTVQVWVLLKTDKFFGINLESGGSSYQTRLIWYSNYFIISISPWNPVTSMQPSFSWR